MGFHEPFKKFISTEHGGAHQACQNGISNARVIALELVFSSRISR